MDDQTIRRLLARSGWDAARLTQLQPGMWSRAWAFDNGGRSYVVRLSGGDDDFVKDRFATRYRRDELPVPEVVEIGHAADLDAAYAISERVPGTPLEATSADRWALLVPSVADLLEALRSADLPPGGWGPWDGGGRAHAQSWGDHLRQVGDYPWHRSTGWRQRLDRGESSVFAAAHRSLSAIDLDETPRCLVHADLLNRNVHTDGTRIAGVFDWGNACYGDHLYDLAWFVFWSPWHPNLDVDVLLAELSRRWVDAGVAPSLPAGRWDACLLHIGLDHIVYNAVWGTAEDLSGTIARMRDLGLVRP